MVKKKHARRGNLVGWVLSRSPHHLTKQISVNHLLNFHANTLPQKNEHELICKLLWLHHQTNVIDHLTCNSLRSLSLTHVLSPGVSIRKETEPALVFVVSVCSMAFRAFKYYTLNYFRSTDRTSIPSSSKPPDDNAVFKIEHPRGRDMLGFAASFFHVVQLMRRNVLAVHMNFLSPSFCVHSKYFPKAKPIFLKLHCHLSAFVLDDLNEGK